MALREFVLDFTLHSSFSFYIAIATMPFDSDIYLINFVFQFFLFAYRVSVYFHSRNCPGFNWNFAFSSAENEDKLKSRLTVRFG